MDFVLYILTAIAVFFGIATLLLIVASVIAVTVFFFAMFFRLASR